MLRLSRALAACAAACLLMSVFVVSRAMADDGTGGMQCSDPSNPKCVVTAGTPGIVDAAVESRQLAFELQAGRSAAGRAGIGRRVRPGQLRQCGRQPGANKNRGQAASAQPFQCR